jgi:hypothetical protein
VSADNAVQLFSVAESTRTNTYRFDRKVNYVRIDYKMRRIMVSWDKKVSVVSGGHVVEEYQPPFDDFHYIFPLYGMYFLTTKSGMLYWSSSHRF